MLQTGRKPHFTPGFRCYPQDLLTLVAAVLCANWLWQSAHPLLRELAVAILFVVGHFFLFCNLVRMSRPAELLWATTFTLLLGGYFHYATPSLSAALLASSALTLLLVVRECRSPRYHGLGWQWLNPGLMDKNRIKSNRYIKAK